MKQMVSQRKIKETEILSYTYLQKYRGQRNLLNHDNSIGKLIGIISSVPLKTTLQKEVRGVSLDYWRLKRYMSTNQYFHSG